jgi:threonine aldolase
MVHCDKRGSELVCGSWSHVFRFEQGSASSLAGVFIHKIENNENGTFSIDEVRALVRGSDIHDPITQLVVVENTHNMAGNGGNTSFDLSILINFFNNRWKSLAAGVD